MEPLIHARNALLIHTGEKLIKGWIELRRERWDGGYRSKIDPKRPRPTQGFYSSRLQPKDEAEHYCVTWYNSAPHRDTGRWESGTRTLACQNLFHDNF